MLNYQNWKNYIEKNVIPLQLENEVAESWRRAKKSGLNFDSKVPLRLSAHDFNKRRDENKGMLNNLERLVGKAKLLFKGSVFFVDKDEYLLYKVNILENSRDIFCPMVLGCKVSEEYIGNTSTTLAIKLQKPYFLCNYEHINPLYHPLIVYAEPVWVKGRFIGALGISIESKDFEIGKKLLYNVLRSLLEGCLLEYTNKEMSHNTLATANHGFVSKYNFAQINFSSSEMTELINKAKLISKSDQSVLIYGESGTGKEIMANAIHMESYRNDGNFVSVNCAALTPSLMESELFGYSEGSFTGAIKGGKKGKIELAQSGTLFLDEIGDLPLTAQAMLLRALQEGEFARIGDDKVTRVDFRLISATNKDLRNLCEERLFRWDLYYRIAGLVLLLPPLRERREDIPAIVQQILEDINMRNATNIKIDDEAMKVLVDYDWPGNIRELINIMESAYLFAKNDFIRKTTIYELFISAGVVVDKIEKQSNYSKKNLLQETLEQTNGKISEVAKILNVSRATIYRWLKEKQED